MIYNWFLQDHIKEWLHGVGLQNTLTGLEKFFKGGYSTTYWIGYDRETPFAFLITSPEGEDAITLDLFICDLKYLGKGLAVPMIREFLVSQFPHTKRVLIDPEATNARAIHVYQKVGFKIIGEFIASWHPVPHYQMELFTKNMKQLSDLKNVGKATLADLHLLNIHTIEELASQDATALFHALEKRTQTRQDPCVWDVFAAIIHEAAGGKPTAWWEWTDKRKTLQKKGLLKHVI